MDKRIILFKSVNVCKRNELNKEKFPMEYYNVPKYWIEYKNGTLGFKSADLDIS